MPIGKKLSIYYVLGFVVTLILMLVQITLGGINAFLLFSLFGVMIFLGSAFYENKLSREMLDSLKVYYHDDQKAEKHMNMYRKLIKIKMYIGLLFLSSSVMCLRIRFSSFTDYFYSLQLPKNVAGIIAVFIGSILYSHAKKIYNSESSVNFPGGIVAFKTSCIFIVIVGIFFLGM